MRWQTFTFSRARRIAFMGCAYGNVPALEACIRHARDTNRCDLLVFLGDATGCCGHSDETLALIREHFDITVAGNHEQEVVAGSDHCGCGYDDPEDEQYSCLAHQYALRSISDANRRWLGTWPDAGVLGTDGGSLLLSHGSPARTNQFLYESTLESVALDGWLEHHRSRVLVCTHTGLPWVRPLDAGRVAMNCGATGKPDHDGDPSVHYGMALLDDHGCWHCRIERVGYDHRRWAARLRAEGVDERFITPLLTGRWTVGVKSLPAAEAERPFPG